MKRKKIRIEIDYNTIMMDKTGKMMSKFDFNIDRIVVPPIIVTFTTTAKVDKAYKERMIKELREEFKDEFVVYGIKFFYEAEEI